MDLWIYKFRGLCILAWMTGERWEVRTEARGGEVITTTTTTTTADNFCPVAIFIRFL